MAEHDEPERHMPSDSATRQRQHRRTTSAFAVLDSHPQNQPNASSSTALPTARSAHADTQSPPTPFRYHRSPHSLSANIDNRSTPSSRSKVTNVGKDWESWRLSGDADKINDGSKVPWSRADLKKTGLALSRGKLQQTCLPVVQFTGGVQTTMLYSPRAPVSLGSTPPPLQKPSQLSPVSLGPQSSSSSEASKAPSPQPPSPDRNDLPKYMSAFEFAMRPFLEAHTDLEHQLRLPSLAQQELLSRATSPLLPPLRGDEISYTSSEEEDTLNEIPEYGIPAYLAEKDPFRTNLRLIQLRTLLMQCTILQSTVRDLERKPWALDAKRPPFWYYSKICHLAHKARRYAEALGSRDLRARCEYWAGRGCGGTRDYEAAKEHFGMALRFDVENDMYPSGKVRLRGLRPIEKADVRFLLDSVSGRHEVWERKAGRARKRAGVLSEESAKPMAECIDAVWKGLDSPLWMPDRDRVVNLARKEFDIRKKLGTRAKHLGDLDRLDLDRELEEKVQAQWKDGGILERELTRRVLSAKEWRYIRYGDGKAAQQNRRRRLSSSRPVILRCGSRTAVSSSSSGSGQSSTSSSRKVSQHSLPTLSQELEHVERQSLSPSSSSLAQTP